MKVKKVVALFAFVIFFSLTISIPDQIEKYINIITEIIERVFMIAKKLLNVIYFISDILKIKGVDYGLYNNSGKT